MSDSLSLVCNSVPLFLKGCVVTLQIFVFSSVLSIFLGYPMGILMTRQLDLGLLSIILGKITFVLRAVPVYVQLLITYFVLPDLLGINISPYIASILALGFCSSGYVAQFVRGAANAVPLSHWEAAQVLGYTKGKTLSQIILPQACALSLPALGNELDALLKSTAITASIGILELTRMGMNIVSREMEPIPVYLSVAIFYIALSALINLGTRKIEKRISYAFS